MLICGIKASHDGAVALVENGRLLFSVELEKLDNGMRHAALGSLDRVGEVLRSEGVDPADVDQFVVDGWIDPQHGPAVPTTSGGKPLLLPVAPYLG